MSELGKLSGKAQKFNIGELELSIKPLTVKDMDLMMKLEEGSSDAMNEIIRKILKDAVPDATDEEIDDISIEHLQEIMLAVQTVNGLDPEKNKEFLEKIKDKQKK